MYGEGIQLEVHAGGLTWDPDNLPKLRSTHHTEPIGRAVTLDESPTGVVATFKVASTTAGDDALTLAAEGLQAGLSIEADAPDGITASKDGVYRLTADNPATLTAVALVETPAFASAQVHKVAAQKEDTMTDRIEGAEVPDDVVSSLVTALQSLVESQTAQADPATESEAPVEAAQKLPERKLTASTIVTREPFPYGFDGSAGQSIFKDLIEARSDSLAAQRVDQAMDQVNRLAAADEAAISTDVTVPNEYRDALMVNLASYPRDIADNVPGISISSARPQLIPVVDGFVADGGSGEPVTAHVENSNPASAEVDIDYDTFTPVLYSGKVDVSREAIDAGSPAMDQTLLALLRRSYNNVTDLAAYTSIAGYSGIDTGSSTTDADNTNEARNMLSTIISEMADFKARAGYPADIIWMAPGEFKDVTGLYASDGRPLFPYVNPTNTAGAGVLANHQAIEINGVTAINATNVASTKVVVASRQAIMKFESPTLSFRWDEVAGPAKVRLVLAGYFLCSPIDARGICLITQS